MDRSSQCFLLSAGERGDGRSKALLVKSLPTNLAKPCLRRSFKRGKRAKERDACGLGLKAQGFDRRVHSLEASMHGKSCLLLANPLGVLGPTGLSTLGVAVLPGSPVHDLDIRSAQHNDSAQQ